MNGKLISSLGLSLYFICFLHHRFGFLELRYIMFDFGYKAMLVAFVRDAFFL